MSTLDGPGEQWLRATARQERLEQRRPGIPGFLDITHHPDTFFSGREQASHPHDIGIRRRAHSMSPPKPSYEELRQKMEIEKWIVGEINALRLQLLAENTALKYEIEGLLIDRGTLIHMLRENMMETTASSTGSLTPTRMSYCVYDSAPR
jgi:hypothetical protein